MGKTFDGIDERLETFLRAQHLFFVATAPLAAAGHLNCSPKGLDTFAVLDPRTVAYLDLTGSGVETIAHLRENGRIVLTFAAFAGPPKIVRLHGRGEVVEPEDPRFPVLRARFPAHHDAVRSVIRIAVERIADSCGYGVPLYRLEGAARKGPEGVAQYRAEHNRASIDGLAGLPGRDASR
jgi:Pyridoxamine 5'-phosphate oxidase